MFLVLSLSPDPPATNTRCVQAEWFVPVVLGAVRMAPEHNPSSCALVAFLAEVSETPPAELLADLRDGLVAIYTAPAAPTAARRNVLVALSVLASRHAGALRGLAQSNLR